jgi:membrane protease YdiL (CAAX protease family)
VIGAFWNRDERRLRAAWRIVSFLLLNGGIAALLYSGGRLAVHLGAPPRWLDGPLAILLGVFVELGAVSTSVAVATLWVDRRPLADLGLGLAAPFVQDSAAGLLLGAILMSFVFLVEWSLGWVRVTGFFRSEAGQPFALAVVVPLLVFVAAGLSEELLTRGYLLRNLSEALRLGPVGPQAALVTGCLLSSAAFGLGHAHNPNATLVSTFNIALAGILLSFGYMVTGRLGLSIGLHITWNFVQCSVFGFPVSGLTEFRASVLATRDAGPEIWTGGAFGPEGGLVGVLAMLLGIFLVGVWAEYRYGRAELQVALLDPPSRRTSIAA